ncbi:predicted protein [Naegleria gruberi]|uniref:Predicted protein n=1 Tax=Naegleria gruberi TaxID=5762 RepID=D2VI10_NAEGR|nr:uncharacterized protein NAEGRDRAFT_68517 [Naegleria gruberi]EFC43509.1 predicted protein [Naegleria gruberi]|eukprot:XP_002676253.1 predicted protein [Naegleria gruberi strain NEG-M]
MSSTTPTTPNRILLPRRSNFGSGTYLCNNNNTSTTSPPSSTRRASIAPSTFPIGKSSCNTSICSDSDPAVSSQQQEKSNIPIIVSSPDQSLEKKSGGFLRSRTLFGKTKSSPLFSSCVSESDIMFDQDIFSHRPKKKELQQQQQDEPIKPKAIKPNYFTSEITTDDENEFEKQTTNFPTTPTRITNNIRSIEKAFEELENAPASSTVNTIIETSTSDSFDNDYTEEDDSSLILNTSTSTTMTNSSVLSSDEQTPTSLSNSLFLSSFSSTVSSLEATDEAQSFASLACSSFTFGSEQHNKETTDTLNSRAYYLRRHSNIATAPLFSSQTSNQQSSTIVNIPSTVHMNSEEWKSLLISCLSTVNNDQSTLIQLKSLLHERFNNVIRQRQEFRCFLRCISFSNYYNCTLMHIAAKFGQIDTLKFLYKECPELLLQRDSRRFTPLFYILLEDANSPITLDDKKKGETCKQICEFLWKWTFGETFSKCYLLGKPRFQDMKKKFHKCLTQQISLDFSTTNEEIPTVIDVFFESLKQGKLSICRNLLEYGLDINECPFDHNKQTSGNIPFFHKTCIELPLASILFLIRHGANALKMDSFNNLPFTYLVGRVENNTALLPQVIKFMKQRFEKYQVPQHYSKLLVKLSFIQNQNMRSLLFSCVNDKDFESALFLIEEFNSHIDDSPDSPLWIMLKDENKVNVLDLLKKQMNDPGCMNNTHFSEIINLLENLLNK